MELPDLDPSALVALFVTIIGGQPLVLPLLMVSYVVTLVVTLIAFSSFSM